MAPRSSGSNESPVIVIVGETASGKSALAIELAKQFNGEIISADSRTVYRGMDIGTAKPTLEERQGIAHYGFDLAEPRRQFTAYDFQQLAKKCVANITNRYKLPIIVGGTGLYIDAYLYNFVFRPRADETTRSKLQMQPVSELQKRVIDAGLALPENTQNPRHLRRLLEVGPPPQQIKTLRPNTLVLGLMVPRNELEQRITARVESMLDAGLVDEVKALTDRYGSVEALRAPSYKAFASYLKGEIDLAEAKHRVIRDDLSLAKRQRTWFKRNPHIHWIEGENKLAQATKLVSAFLHR